MHSNKTVLHLTTHLGGGVGRVVLNYLAKAKKDSKFIGSVASLDYINDNAKKVLSKFDIEFLENLSQNHERLVEWIKSFDIVLIHWWNHPLMYEFLVKATLLECRVVFWSHISGLHSPSNFTKPVFDYADTFVFTTPISYDADVVKKELTQQVREKILVIWSTGGLEHVKNVKLKKHKSFNVGYIGTVDYAKLHRNFLEISSQVDIDDIKFIVCGGDDEKKIENEAKVKKIDDKFDFLGPVDDITVFLEKFDLFGYPLSPYHFGTCDQVLAEAMACGIVPVVFGNPMEAYMVEDNVTGLVVNNEKEYSKAIEKLYSDKALKKRLSLNAKKYAFEKFSLEKLFHEWENCLLKCLEIEPNKKHWSGKYSGEEISGFEVFLESSGTYAKHFENLIYSDDENSKDSSLKIIKKELLATGVWESDSKGTLNQYIRYFAGDKNLKLLKKYLN